MGAGRHRMVQLLMFVALPSRAMAPYHSAQDEPSIAAFRLAAQPAPSSAVERCAADAYQRRHLEYAIADAQMLADRHLDVRRYLRATELLLLAGARGRDRQESCRENRRAIRKKIGGKCSATARSIRSDFEQMPRLVCVPAQHTGPYPATDARPTRFRWRIGTARNRIALRCDAAHEAVWLDAFWEINSRADFRKAVRAMIRAAVAR